MITVEIYNNHWIDIAVSELKVWALRGQNIQSSRSGALLHLSNLRNTDEHNFNSTNSSVSLVGLT